MKIFAIADTKRLPIMFPSIFLHIITLKLNSRDMVENLISSTKCFENRWVEKYHYNTNHQHISKDQIKMFGVIILNWDDYMNKMLPILHNKEKFIRLGLVETIFVNLQELKKTKKNNCFFFFKAS